MKKYFWVDCHNVQENFHKTDENVPVFYQIRVDLHLLLCPHCSDELNKLKVIKEIMMNDFLFQSPELEGVIMEKINDGQIEEESENNYIPAGFSFRSWVIIGFLVLFSLSSTFLGYNFLQIANEEGLSFLLPIGLTIGIVLTCYGAIFIGSHLKELSSRFGIHS